MQFGTPKNEVSRKFQIYGASLFYLFYGASLCFALPLRNRERESIGHIPAPDSTATILLRSVRNLFLPLILTFFLSFQQFSHSHSHFSFPFRYVYYYSTSLSLSLISHSTLLFIFLLWISCHHYPTSLLLFSFSTPFPKILTFFSFSHLLPQGKSSFSPSSSFLIFFLQFYRI